MRRTLLLAFLICISEFAFSQTSFLKGYVIIAAGDTVPGWVGNREGSKSYESCEFKKSETQSPVTYGPNEISGFGLSNKRSFESKDISKDQVSKRVFLEVLVKGIVSLYKYEDAYFIEKDGEGLNLMTNEVKEKFIDGKAVLQPTKQYVGVLSRMLFDCVDLRAKVQRAVFDEGVLSKLVENYNKCKGTAPVNYNANNKPWLKALFGITGGVNFSKIHFRDNEDVYAHLNGKFEYSKSPIVGLSLDVLSPRISQRMSLHADFLYTKSKYHNANFIGNSYFNKRNYVTIELQELKIPVGFRFTFPEKKVTPYINLGVSGTIHLKHSSSWVQDVELNHVVSTSRNEALEINNFQFGVWGGCGISTSVHNKFNAFVELRYEQTNGIDDAVVDGKPNADSKIMNLQIFVGIRTK